jgi:hypothetical protein
VCNLHYITGDFAFGCDFVIDTFVVAVILGKAFCDCRCVYKGYKRCVFDLNRIIRLRYQIASFRLYLLNNLTGNVRVFLAYECTRTCGYSRPVCTGRKDTKTCCYEVIARFAERDFVAQGRCALEQLCRFGCRLRVGVFGYDYLGNRRCVINRTACVDFACVDCACLAVPQPFNANCTVKVNLERCTNREKHLREVFTPCCDRKPTVELDVLQVRFDVNRQWTANVLANLFYGFTCVNAAVVVCFIEQTDGRSAGEMIGVDGRSADLLHIVDSHLFIIMEIRQWCVADKFG